MYQQSVAHAFTIFRICGVFAATLILIAENYLHLLLCLVFLIIEIPFCMVSWTLTLTNLNVFRIDWPTSWQSHILLAVFHCFVPFIGYPHILEYFSISVACMFIFTPCLLHHSHPIHWDQTKVLVCQSIEERPTQAQEVFTLVPHLFGTTSRCLSAQPFHLLPSGNISRHIA